MAPPWTLDTRDAGRRWVECGGADLTGEADGPPLTPAAPVASIMDAAGAVVGVPDAAKFVAMRGLHRRGATSCNGTTRLYECADGWLAVALPRQEDVDAVPAWIGGRSLESRTVFCDLQIAGLATQARLLELPVSALGERPHGESPWVATQVRSGAPRHRAPRVVDLSALWAGPLCGHLLGLNGASVIKAEDPRRPDGARATPDFFAALNGAKQEQAIDISADLPALLADADVVITSARPRAFEQLGIDVNAVLRDQNVVWIAITAHGWDGPGRNRVGFGDDAAVAAGLVVDLGDGRPGFVGDAVADPLCGVLAAAAATIYLGEGGSWFVDISLSGAAAYAVTS